MTVALRATPRTAPRTPDPRSIREALDLSRERMARLFDVSAKTVERWETSGRLPTNRFVQRELGKVEEIVRLGLSVYTREGFTRFMKSALPDLGGRTPLQAIEQGDADRVFGIIAGDHEGLGY